MLSHRESQGKLDIDTLPEDVEELAISSEHRILRRILCRGVLSRVTRALFFVVILAVVDRPWAEAPLTVTCNEGQLSVTAEHVPLAQILQALASHTGLQVRGGETLQAEAALQQADPNSRLVHLQDIRNTEPRQGSHVLLAAADDADPSIRQVAYEQLYERGETAQLTALLQQAVQSADSDRRRTRFRWWRTW